MVKMTREVHIKVWVRFISGMGGFMGVGWGLYWYHQTYRQPVLLRERRLMLEHNPGLRKRLEREILWRRRADDHFGRHDNSNMVGGTGL